MVVSRTAVPPGEAAPAKKMGDESAMSGMSTGDAGGPALGGAQQGGAEGVIKKLSNYWFIIGSIPLVLFLMVCLPTMFYVQSISTYVNAFYCRSKACDKLAEVTKAVREGGSCDSFYKTVCKASPKHSLKGVLDKDVKFLVDMSTSYGETPPPRVAMLSGAAPGCKAKGEDKPDSLSAALTYFTGDAKLKPLVPYAEGNTYLDIYKKAQMLGIDSIFHLELVHSSSKKIFEDSQRTEIGEKLPQHNNFYDLAVSAPDMGIMEPSFYTVTLGKKNYDAMTEDARVILTDNSDDPAEILLAKAASKYYYLFDAARDKDYTAAPVVLPIHEFGSDPPNPVPFKDLLTNIYPRLGRVIVRSPAHVKYLAAYIKPGDVPTDEVPFTMKSFKYFVVLDALMKLAAYRVSKVADPIKDTWCFRYIDWLRPLEINTMSDTYLKTYWPFALNNPKDAKKPYLGSDLGFRYMAELTDSFLHSYALSEASSEKSRAGLYLKMLQLDKLVFYRNSSADSIDASYTEALTEGPPGDGSIPPLLDSRKKFFVKYWNLNPAPIDRKFLIARHPLMYSDDEGSYDYGSNTMYVPFGMFRPTFHRDSTVYMGNHAVFGYWGSMNLLKMLDNIGAHSKVGYQHPVLWTGTYAFGKMSWLYRCLNPAADNGTDARMVAKGTNPITPGFRFFRRVALARALPRPDYRLDADATARMEEIYLTAVGQTYCRYTELEKSVNKMFQHDLYFQKTYCSQGGKLKLTDDKTCYIWRSTRRSY